MKIVLWLLRESGVRNVPKYLTFRKLQTELRQKCGVSTIHRMSPKGNSFSFNNPCDLVRNVSCIFNDSFGRQVIDTLF